MDSLLYLPTTDEMHNFYCANTLINLSSIYRRTFLFLPLDYYLST